MPIKNPCTECRWSKYESDGYAESERLVCKKAPQIDDPITGYSDYQLCRVVRPVTATCFEQRIDDCVCQSCAFNEKYKCSLFNSAEPEGPRYNEDQCGRSARMFKQKPPTKQGFLSFLFS